MRDDRGYAEWDDELVMSDTGTDDDWLICPYCGRAVDLSESPDSCPHCDEQFHC